MSLKINYLNLARQLLPPHKRLPNILRLLRVLMAPLTELFSGFDTWRDEIRVEMNMTCQVGVLEGYLRAKYGNNRIKIETVSDRGIAIGLRHEGQASSVQMGLRYEGVPIAIPLPGELAQQFGDVDYVVYLPAGMSAVSVEKIRIDLERYKLALSNYKIEER